MVSPIMQTDIVIIGAGAAGLMCAIEAGRRGRKVLVLDHAAKPAEKIRISGGGRCNFTNLHTSPKNFISQNPHFCVSALKRYTQHDFIGMVRDYGIAYHEKTLGQLFCDDSAQDIIKMLLAECDKAGVRLQLETEILKISHHAAGFSLKTNRSDIACAALVVACGGPSIPKMGASSFGYEIANQFGIDVVPPRAGLVPLVFDPIILAHTQELTGVTLDPVVTRSLSGMTFREGMVFTHKGISGPAILQISSYWKPGEPVMINLCPDTPMLPWLKEQRQVQPRSMLKVALQALLPKRLVEWIVADLGLDGRMADLSDKQFKAVSDRIENWTVKPSGSEGYRTAEVTVGGVSTEELSSKTFESKKVPGLYFIGEVVDVTGHLGGHNFQWAWSSGWCAGQYV